MFGEASERLAIDTHQPTCSILPCQSLRHRSSHPSSRAHTTLRTQQRSGPSIPRNNLLILQRSAAAKQVRGHPIPRIVRGGHPGDVARITHRLIPTLHLKASILPLPVPILLNLILRAIRTCPLRRMSPLWFQLRQLHLIMCAHGGSREPNRNHQEDRQYLLHRGLPPPTNGAMDKPPLRMCLSPIEQARLTTRRGLWITDQRHRETHVQRTPLTAGVGKATAVSIVSERKPPQ